MKVIELLKLRFVNFKGCKDFTIDFKNRTNIFGANATGKTTIIDVFMWLMFDKDSTGASKFQIRPLDENGNQIDNVGIMVEATLVVDGKEVVLKKTQKQNWVKKRGTDVSELQGNVNSFEINTYPKAEKEYKEYISSLVDEELFKLITNPQVFASLPWKKQREVLTKLVSEVSDFEIAQGDAKFAGLLQELEQASTDDIQKKYGKALSEWKKKQIELPARIDEVSKQITDIDVSDLELQKNCLKEQIEETENQYSDSESAIKEYDKASSEIIRLKGEMSSIFEKANECLNADRKAIQKRIDDAKDGFEKARSQTKLSESRIEQLNKSIEQNEAEKVRLQGSWKEEKGKSFVVFEEFPSFDENALICPTCGQELTEELKNKKITDYEERKKQRKTDYDNSKKLFEDKQKERLTAIEEQGNTIVWKIKKDKSEIEQIEAQMKQSKEDSVRFVGEQNKAMEELSKLPQSADLSDNQVYEALQLQVANLEQSLQSMDTGANYRNQLKIRISGLREELSMVEKKISSADNTAVEERIEELQTEQKEIGQKVADQEKMIYLLEEFIRAKMNRISESISAKFKTVSWKLFDMQLNGGMKEMCECTVGGVPYSSLNSSHKIIAGLDIISSLSALYGVSAPIFIDNAEALNDFNIPEMDCQMALLKVSDDAELRIEVA